MRTWRTYRASISTPETVTYHEAGHAVVAFEHGWRVRRGGVRAGAWPHARLYYPEAANTATAHICVSMAGLVAEEEFHGARWGWEGDVIKHFRAVRAGQDSESFRLYPSDLRSIAMAIFEDDPTTTLAGARRVVAYCRTQTDALLAQPRVWAGVERVAKALVRRRYLSPRMVGQLLGEAFFAGIASPVHLRRASDDL